MKHTVKLLTLAATLVAVIGLAGCSPNVDAKPQDSQEQNTPQETWDDGVVTKEPTCTAEGVKTYTCSNGETKTETIPALGHDYGGWVVTKEATCTEDGEKKHTCKREGCGHFETKVIPATHDYQGGYCERCGGYEFENKFTFFIFTSEEDWKETCVILDGVELSSKLDELNARSYFSFKEKENDITLDELIQLKSKYENYKVGWFSYKSRPWNREEYDPDDEPGINNIRALVLVPKTE